MGIGSLKLGKVDGKDEFLLEDLSSTKFFDAFLLPDNINVSSFVDRELYFITGFRGTGKTSLLRYLLSRMQPDVERRSIILFKSDISEDKRQALSTNVGLVLAEADSNKMGIAQDFKSAWTWFALHQIANKLKSVTHLAHRDENLEAFFRLMGLADERPFKKILGYLPRLEGAKVRVTADAGFIAGEIDADFGPSDSGSATVLFSELADAALARLLRIQLSDKIVIGFDELEVFFHFPEQYQRDLSMVRDIVFAIDKLNGRFRAASLPVYLLAAIRREVVDAIGPLGQEVNRLTHDRGVGLAWHHASKSMQHPLIEMIRKKIRASEPELSGDPMEVYFPSTIAGEDISTYLLDRSFYRPRDIMWRLTFAQKYFPQASQFDERSMGETESEYSAQPWNEIEYELSASYGKDDIDALTSIFSGIKQKFFLADLEKLASEKAKYSQRVNSFCEKRSLVDVCELLYSHGALGNDFRTSGTASKFRNRWVFRGDTSLIADQRMTLNPAVRKALSAIDARKRGSRGGGSSKSGESLNKS